MLQSIVSGILIQPVVLTFNEIDDGFVVVDHKACPCRIKQINAFFEENKIVQIDWPSNSPDLNRIKNVII